MLHCQHSGRDVESEFFNLFPNVPHEGVTGPPADHHDREDRYAAQVHCHGCSGSYGVRSDFVPIDAKVILAMGDDCVL